MKTSFFPASPKISSASLRASENWKALYIAWQEILHVLRFCHEWNTSASGRKDKEHQKTAMRTIAVIVYDAVNPFELGVATEVFGFEHPELGMPWYRFLICADEPRPIRISAGIYLTTPYSFEHVDEADTIIVPGSRLRVLHPV
jgi:hypothetical protein